MVRVLRKLIFWAVMATLVWTTRLVRASARTMATQVCAEDSKQRWERVQSIIGYHDATKHQLEKYARGPGYMDWQHQPSPWREYPGARLFPLELTDVATDHTPFPHLFTGKIASQELTYSSISRFLRDSLALSSWKSFRGNSWALRCNPSSGNLHPTEGTILIGPVTGLSDQPAVYHYRPRDHALELRATVPTATWTGASHIMPANSFFIGLSSIHWREAWKYGERAFRYCQHDVGHAIEALSVSAAGLGWSTSVLDDVLTTSELKHLMGLHQHGEDVSLEEPDCLILITTDPIKRPIGVSARGLKAMADDAKVFVWQGRPNRLSARQVPWPVIDEASSVSERASSLSEQRLNVPAFREVFASDTKTSVRRIIHQRRSAVDFDEDHEPRMSARSFYQILRSVSPAFSSIPWSSQVHLAIFVHTVEDIEPGMFFFLRNQEHLEELRNSFDKDYLWMKPDNCPEGMELYRLAYGDTRDVAKTVSCHQDIAKDGSFSLGMIARFEGPITEHGPWFYRRLFWEAGMIGQRLYLQAEAVEGGFRGTGIGCFFDDVMHSILGIKDHKYQSLYHFTIGYPIVDERLSTLDPYHHLPPERTASSVPKSA